MSDVRATATGTLATTPIPHLLVYLLDKRLTGTVVLELPGAGRSALLVEQGQPVKAKTADPVILLGDLLVERELIDEQERDAIAERAKADRMLYGQALLRAAALSESDLRDALEEQLTRRLVWMFSLPPETVYGYYDGRNYLERWGLEPLPLDPLAILTAGVRRFPNTQAISDTLVRLQDRQLRLHLDSKAARFRFDGKEQAVADVLRLKPQSLAALLASEIADLETVRRVVYVLTITRHLDIGVPGIRPVGVDPARVSGTFAFGSASSRPPPVTPRNTSTPTGRTTPPANPVGSGSIAPGGSASRPPGPSSAELAAFRAEIQELADRMNLIDHYELLGVGQRASSSEIQMMYFKLAKRWHPDRLPAELGEARDVAMRVFARMTEAVRVLTDEQQRKNYDDLLQSGANETNEQEQVQRVLRAATAYQKAQVLLRTNQLAQAELEARSAAEDDPDQGEYKALHAWIVAQKQSTDAAKLEELIAVINRAANGEPNNERILFYRAQLLRRAGKDDAAYKDFKAVLELNPRNVDAAREVRLYKMRRPSSAPPARDSKLPPKSPLTKLFKR